MDAPAGQITDPVWRTKPGWYMVTIQDRMILRQPSAMSEQIGAIVAEVAANHSVYVSQSASVADLINQAAQGVAAHQPDRAQPACGFAVGLEASRAYRLAHDTDTPIG